MRTYDKYKSSGIDWIDTIPEHWETLPLFTTFCERYEKNTKEEVEDVLSLSYGKIILRDVSTNFGLLPESFKTYQIAYPSDIIIRPTDLQNDQRSLRVGKVEQKGIITSAYICLKPLKLNSSYAHYLLHAYDLLKIYYKIGAGVRQTLKFEDLKRLPILIPLGDEQIAIAEYLDEKTAQIDSLIESKLRLIKLLTEERTTIIDHAVTRGINPNAKLKHSGIEWLGEIPEHWEIKKLRYIGQCQNGISKGAEYFGSGYPFVSYGDVYKNMTLPSAIEGLANSTDEDRLNYSVEAGDVFFTRTSETVEEIGFTSTCIKTIDNAIFSGFIIRFRPLIGCLFSGFSKYYFRSSLHRRFFVKEMNLVTRASLSQELLKKLPILLPPLDEQEKVSVFLDNSTNKIDATIEKIGKEIAFMREYRTALISEVVMGKVKVV